MQESVKAKATTHCLARPGRARSDNQPILKQARNSYQIQNTRSSVIWTEELTQVLTGSHVTTRL